MVVGDDAQSYDLRLPRRRHPQHPRVRGHVSRRARGQARAELSLDADDPRRGQRGHPQQPGAEGQITVDRARPGRSDQDPRARGRACRGAIRDRRGPAAARRRRLAGRGRGVLPDQRTVARTAGHPGPRGYPLPGDRRHEVLRARGDQGRDRIPDHARQSSGRRRVHPGRQLAASRDRLDLDVATAGLHQHDGDVSLGRASDPSRCRTRRSRGESAQAVHGDHARAPRAGRVEAAIAELLKEVLQETGYLEALEAERTIEAQGRSRTSRNWSTSRANTTRWPRRIRARGGARGLPRAGRADLRRRRPQRRRGPGHVDDAAQRQGSRVPDRVHDRM